MRNVLIFFHGYGVRGNFWPGLSSQFPGREFETLTPDLAMQDLPTLIDTSSMFVRTEAAGASSSAKPGERARICLIGHSLGAVVAAVVANNLGPDLVSHVVMIAPPSGEQRTPMKGLMRLLIRYRLIPKFLARPRFYSALTPKATQKSLFAAAVPESPRLQDAIFADRWFHEDILTGPLPQPSLVICSESDAIVSSARSLELAARIGARTHVFERTRGVAHDDFVGSPEIAREVANTVGRFLDG